MTDPRFELLESCPLVIDGPALLRNRALLSPYVWREDQGYCLLLRAVPPDDEVSGRIWLGRGQDGVRFRMDATPLIVPSLPDLDIGGCEDPTVLRHDGSTFVFYTGVDKGGRGELLYAAGSDIRSLEKRGVAFSCSRTELNTKEASIDLHDGCWRLFHEYARDNRSLIGLAIGPSPSGPWDEQPDVIHPRPGRWDGHHLSTGPLLSWGADELLMFYNGATDEPRWSIGWATFDRATLALRARCDEPLIVPPEDNRGGAAIVFAASVLDEGDIVQLYYSLDDDAPRRATLRRR